VLTRALLIAAAVLAPCAAADLTFTGSLRFVSASTITVRLSNGIVIDARLPKSGELAAETISAQYKFADQVQVSCKHVDSVWDEPVKRFHSLELTRIHFIRAGFADEIAGTLASLVWQPGGNLLRNIPEAPKTAHVPDPEGMDRVRSVNLARAANMPNFVADEAAVRFLRQKSASKWKQADIVEAQIGFHGDDANRDQIRINGKPYKTPSGWIPGINWDIGFGAELKALLDRDCANTFEFAGREEYRGRQVQAYRFRTPLDGCFGPGVVGFQQYDSAKAGRILVDAKDGSVLQVESENVDSPRELDGGSNEIRSWDYVTIGDASYLLPITLEVYWTQPNGLTWHVAVQYKNHRHFESSSIVRFNP
jgi:hypothetical protein